MKYWTHACFQFTKYPENICLDEEVLKKSFVFVFRRRQASWSKWLYPSWSHVFEMFSRSFQDSLPTRPQDNIKTSSVHLQDILKTFWQDRLKASSKSLQDVMQRCLQEIFKTFPGCTIKLNCSCQQVFNTSLICIQHVFEMQYEHDYLQKDFPRSKFLENYGQGTKLLKLDTLDMLKRFKNRLIFLNFMNWLLLKTKILLLKSGIGKNVAVSVNKESLNKGSSKNVFLSF